MEAFEWSYRLRKMGRDMGHVENASNLKVELLLFGAGLCSVHLFLLRWCRCTVLKKRPLVFVFRFTKLLKSVALFWCIVSSGTSASSNPVPMHRLFWCRSIISYGVGEISTLVPMYQL